MLPLEGVGDYVDLTLIVNPWQAIVATVAIFAILIWPQLSARQSVRRVEKSLTQNNGGSTIKDQLDRLEKAQADQGKKLTEHTAWSEGYVREQDERLRKLEDQPRGLLRRRRKSAGSPQPD